MSFKRIALCVMYAMIAMFAINTATADAEDEAVVNGSTGEEIVVEYNNGLYDAGAHLLQDETVINDTDVQNDMNVSVQNGGLVDDSQAGAKAAESEASQSPVVEADTSKDNDDTSDKKVNKKSGKDSKANKAAAAKYTKAELRLLSALIYCEAGNEPYAGKLAVGIVVMNRKESRAFANSVKGVIYQRFQFSPVRNGSLKRALARYDSGRFNSSADKQCLKAAKEALSGKKVVSYNGKNKNFKKFMFFNGYVRGARYRIKGHMFK